MQQEITGLWGGSGILLILIPVTILLLPQFRHSNSLMHKHFSMFHLMFDTVVTNFAQVQE